MGRRGWYQQRYQSQGVVVKPGLPSVLPKSWRTVGYSQEDSVLPYIYALYIGDLAGEEKAVLPSTYQVYVGDLVGGEKAVLPSTYQVYVGDLVGGEKAVLPSTYKEVE